MYCFFFHNFRTDDFYHYELMFIIHIFVTILFCVRISSGKAEKKAMHIRDASDERV